MTRLISWNCNMAFRNKYELVLDYDPDVLVVQECECPDTVGEWSEFADWRWIGANEHKGLGIFTRNGVSLRSASVAGTGGTYTLPIETSGAVDVLGVWAMNDEQTPENRYVGQVYSAARDYRQFLGQNTVVAGDFNWNVMWDDDPKYPLCGDFSDTVALLDDCGLQSAYHATTHTRFGNEQDPTFFMHKKREREYHTDYVFVPSTTAESPFDCTVGTYDEWINVAITCQ